MSKNRAGYSNNPFVTYKMGRKVKVSNIRTGKASSFPTCFKANDYNIVDKETIFDKRYGFVEWRIL